MSRRVVRGAGIVLLSVLALTGCSAVEAEFGGGEQSEAPEAPEQSERRTSDPQIHESRIRLSDGRVVTCLKRRAGYSGGLSCDWDNATAPDSPSASDEGE